MAAPALCGEGIPPPISEVTQVGFHRSLVTAASSRRLTSPLVLQRYLWPIVIRGRSVVCVSKHNSGKTVGYILPVMSCVMEMQEQWKQKKEEYGPIALILVSSTQMAKQVGKICTALLTSTESVSCVVLHSDISERVAYSQLLNGCSILISTPEGFLKAVLLPYSHRYTFTNLRRIAHLVIDEAEILLSKYKDSVGKILQEIRQALLERKNESGSYASMQFIVTAAKWTDEVDEFYQSLAPYQPILVKGAGFQEVQKQKQ